MNFSTVAQTFQSIEALSSRLEITAALADLYKEAAAQEASIISYLALGCLRPSYEGNQFNVAEKNLAHVVAQLCAISPDEVMQQKRKLGDLGSVVEHCGSWRTESSLSLMAVYHALIAIEGSAGAGSQEEKNNKIIALCQELDPLSAKYVIRIILGTLRLGFSDMTLIDALSWMEVGNKSLRKELEHGYNICADLGLLAQTLKQDGISGVRAMDIRLGIPIRLAAAERLPNAQEIFNKLGVCNAQPKLDGFRLQIHLDKNDPENPIVRFFSRNLLDMTHMFPDLKEAFLKLDCKSLICEGEAIVFDPNTGHFLPFQETVKRKRKHGIEEAMIDYPLQVYLFDLLYLNGESYLKVPQDARYDTLSSLIARNDVAPKIQMIAQQKITSAQELEHYFLQNIDHGLEGIVVKRPDSLYEPGKRNFNWIKLKRLEEGELEDTIDCVILGYYAGAGKRAQFGIGAFLVGIYNKEEDSYQSIAKIGTGLSDDEWRDLKKRADALAIDHQLPEVEVHKDLKPDVWVYPQIVCQVLADEITKSPLHYAAKSSHELGFALRFPRFMGYKLDRSAQDITTAHEIKRLYEDQFKKAEPR